VFAVTYAESRFQAAPSRPDPGSENQSEGLPFRAPRGLAPTAPLSVGHIEVVIEKRHPAPPHVALVRSTFPALRPRKEGQVLLMPLQ
jgi:hypothetical protein